MSYEIVYERQFVKLQVPNCDIPWILPLTLHGSNNCTEMTYGGRERRVRDWGGLYFNGPNQIPLEAPTSMMEKLESFCGGKYQEHFKRNGKWVDDAALRRFFQNGIKDAKSLEELNEISQTKVSLRCYLSVWNDMKNSSELNRVVYNSEELLQFILDSKLRIRNRVGKEEIYVCIRFIGDKAVPYPKQEFKARKREPKTYDNEYWVLKSIKHNGVYVHKLTSTKLHYCYSNKAARKFGSEKEALTWVETKIKHKFIGVAETLVPERVEVNN